MKLFLPFFLLAALSFAVSAGAAVKIDAGYGWKGGIGLSMLPLVQKTPGSVSVRLVNSGGAAEVIPVTLLGSDGKTVIATAEASVPANGAAEVSLPWTPGSNGWKRIAVTAATDRATAEVPVTVRRLYFPWYNNDPEFDRTLHYPNVVLAPDRESSIYWNSRGAVPCMWKGASSMVKVATPGEYKSYLSEKVADIGAEGILIDEMGGYSDCEFQEDIYLKGLNDLTQQRDDLFVGLWIAGSLRTPFCNITQNIYRPKGVNLLMLEAYLNYLEPELLAIDRYAYMDQRMQVARNNDVLTNTVMVLGVAGNEQKYALTPYDLEDQVIYVRSHAPEMPGMGFFASKGPREVVSHGDALCRKYYIDPVIAVWDRDVRLSNPTPRAGETIRISTDVYNIGGIDAKGVKVRLYDGDRKIAERNLSIPAGGGLPTGRTAAVADWKPAAGWRELRVEVIPPTDASIVSGIATRRVFVR